MHNRILKCKDGIDYEEHSGGLCRYNIFGLNDDDAIDLDDYPDVIIEDNILRNNNDDGIEIILHEYSGPQISYVIRRNLISGNGEDGIQFIDYIDKGSTNLINPDDVLVRYYKNMIKGKSPDLGAFESGSDSWLKQLFEAF